MLDTRVISQVNSSTNHIFFLLFAICPIIKRILMHLMIQMMLLLGYFKPAINTLFD
jgi:hypothetical protein